MKRKDNAADLSKELKAKQPAMRSITTRIVMPVSRAAASAIHDER